MAYSYDFKIGTTLVGMVNVESLVAGVFPMPAPRAGYQPYAEYITLGDNSVSGIGKPLVIWRFGLLSLAQRDALRVYCTGPSTSIFIRTMTNDSADSYANFSGIMVWPLNEERDAGRRLNFDLTFQQLTGA